MDNTSTTSQEVPIDTLENNENETDIFAIICFVVVTVITIILCLYYRRSKSGCVGNVLSGVDILQLLSENKVFPIGPEKGWKLMDFHCDMRMWTRRLDAKTFDVNVYGGFIKIKGSAQLVLQALRNSKLYKEWNPEINDIEHILESPEVTKPKRGSAPPEVQHDIISVDNAYIPSHILNLINKIYKRIKGEVLIQKFYTITRYWHKEEHGGYWFLEADQELQEWYFYLVQPVDGFFEIDQCLLSVVYSPHDGRGSYPHHLAAVKLASFCNYFAYRKLQTPTLNTISLPNEQILQNQPQTSITPTSTTPAVTPSAPNKTKAFEEAVKRVMEDNAAKPTESTFMQKFKNMIDEKKEWYEREKEKKRKQNNIPKLSEDRKALAESILTNDLSQIDVENSNDDFVDISAQDNIPDMNNDVPGAGDTNKNADRKFYHKFWRSNTFSESPSPQEEGLTLRAIRSKLKLDIARKSKSLDLEDENDPPDDASKKSLNPEQELANRVAAQLAEYKDVAYKTRTELLHEKQMASHIDIGQEYEQQAIRTGGWIYCGLEKDVVILRKLNDGSGSLQSYLGKGIISVPPKTVFEALENPRTRVIYDDTLKTVDILHNFSNGMKVVYMYNEVSQLFKKECRDFCVLQEEKIEGAKYVISMRSIHWPDCPTEEDTTRGKFHTSGWIIEPLVRENKLHSTVTYIIQIELGSSKPNMGYVVEEMAAKQPLAIAFLRQYLAPSVAPLKTLNNDSYQMNIPSDQGVVKRRVQHRSKQPLVHVASLPSNMGVFEEEDLIEEYSC